MLAGFLFFAAFFLESVVTYFSIVGLIATFTFSIPIIILALAMDVAKLTSVTFLYRQWHRIGPWMKAYAVPAAAILVTITTIGSYGFLIEHFQSSISAGKENNIAIVAMEDEKSKLERRKMEIDRQIASLPDNSVRGRRQLIASFKAETDQVNSRLVEIDKQLPELKKEVVTQEAHVGPISVIANVFGTDLEHAVQFVVLLIVAVMDPLVIALIIMGNKQLEFVAMDRKQFTPAEEEDTIDTSEEVPEPEQVPEVVEDQGIEPEPSVEEEEALHVLVEEIEKVRTGATAVNLAPLHAAPFASMDEMKEYASAVNKWANGADRTLIDVEHTSKPSECTVKEYE